ncbi:MAG: hypothetical protein JWQ49_3643 [Edaphobacter sp.]|nr:hypothetical protein [Edaphobacter sp.]
MKSAECIWHYTELVRQKEEALGHPAEDGPSLRDMEFLLKAFQWLDTADENQPPAETNALMELIADVRDAWADPDNDPIGRELFPLLSDVHCALGKEMDKVVPEAAESRQRLESLRVLQRVLRRNAVNPPPSLSSRIASKIRSAWVKHGK